MLTLLTQTAIAVLYDIANSGAPGRSEQTTYLPDTIPEILLKLVSCGLIRPCNATGEPESYELSRPFFEISLLDVLEATGENLNCNHPLNESMYLRNRAAASKLGVINQLTRQYLSEIKLPDL